MTPTERLNSERNIKRLKSIYYAVAFVFVTVLLATEYVLTHNGLI